MTVTPIDPEAGELHLAISDFRAERELESLNQARIESLFMRAERFVNAALKPEFVNSLEETSPTFPSCPADLRSEELNKARPPHHLLERPPCFEKEGS